ncbi:MAG: 2-oxoacid:acceptor oxidoreductase subunit alpha [Candidatus Binatia bacterium]|nr:2-oxoacid:acceptor oxidoreductase subunit alpha [Candidatus Binatia bacterium]
MNDGQTTSATTKKTQEVDTVVIRFAGDSGDGMQLTGTQFTNASALAGNDISTLPDFPAEIRAPAGTLAGVSGFQVNLSHHEIFTPGDSPDVLVAMNPAGLKANLDDLPTNGILIVDREAFSELNLKKAGYASNPLTDGSLDKFQLFAVDISKLTTLALKDSGLSNKHVLRCKNFFTLGLMSWLYQRPVEPVNSFIAARFGKNESLLDANKRAFKAGYNFGETSEMFASQYEVRPAEIQPGTYRNITGNAALCLGLVTATRKAKLPLYLGSYPITPASDILHELATYKSYDVVTFQAEDEIAGVGAALGAAFGGALAVTTTSGPGIDLKSETIGLAVKTELPLIVCDIQRGGPSTGLPTKTEQADLLAALYGRHGDAPVIVLAPATPSDCFDIAIEAVRLATKYMTPVYLLSDGYLANGAEPWLLPKIEDLPDIEVEYRTDPEGYYPYLRDPETLSRPWVVPGTPGLEHRIGGLESEYLTGNISYAPANHEQMVRLREQKIAGAAREIPPMELVGPESGDVLVLGWGSTYGAITAGVRSLLKDGHAVSQAHLRYLNPLPPDLGDVLSRFKHVLIPEMNMGHLWRVIRAEYLVDAVGFNKIQGRPFKVQEIISRVKKLLEES